MSPERVKIRANARVPVADIRQHIRAGRYVSHTSGLAPGMLQCNLAIIPQAYAADFLLFCERNPKPCPVVAVGAAGDPMLPDLGADIDVRSDVPRYRVFRDGQLNEELTDVTELWRPDFVSVALGCSFTFENALLRAGLPVRHIEAGCNVPMFRSNIALSPAGRFSGGMVVSMRPIPRDQVNHAASVSARYPHAHGAPVAIGDPASIGVGALDRPDYGDRVEIRAGEVPVFWACGVTPQNVLSAAKLPIVITHSPGHMLIADVAENAATTIYQKSSNQEN